VRVKSIHCTGFQKKNCSREQCEWIKIHCTIHFNEKCDSGAWLHCSVIPPPQEAVKLCFYKTCGTTIFFVGPTSINLYFFFNQTIISMAAGEPHPQPHYQIASKACLRVCLRLLFKVFFTQKCIKINFFLKKLFLISTHQNDLTTSKNINLK
jgi:hypothetical protein